MKYFIDIARNSINKYGEELCGDSVEIVRTPTSAIIVLADGLGSGVKANILSTLTSKIAGTMMKEGAGLYETVDTIMNTLPECSIRKLAYSTFTIVEIHEMGKVYIAEYDNPPVFINSLYRNMDIEKKSININGKIVNESTFCLEAGDSIVITSDGVIHAGIGNTLNLGWQYKNVAQYIKDLTKITKCSADISRNIIDTTMELYDQRPGDDATAVCIKLRKEEEVNIFTGPPKDSSKDEKFVKSFMNLPGKKVVCGGTAARIMERYLMEKIEVDISTMTPLIPPIGRIKGIDLVTEGVITLSKTAEYLTNYLRNSQYEASMEGERNDGVYLLSRMLIENCTSLKFWVGKAVNPAHQNPDLPVDLSIKLKVVDELINIITKLGKNVNIEYIE